MTCLCPRSVILARCSKMSCVGGMRVHVIFYALLGKNGEFKIFITPGGERGLPLMPFKVRELLIKALIGTKRSKSCFTLLQYVRYSFTFEEHNHDDCESDAAYLQAKAPALIMWISVPVILGGGNCWISRRGIRVFATSSPSTLKCGNDRLA